MSLLSFVANQDHFFDVRVSYVRDLVKINNLAPLKYALELRA